MDYFEHPEKIPSEISQLMDEFQALDDADPYSLCKSLLSSIQPLGWTFEYGLDGLPYNLCPIKASLI